MFWELWVVNKLNGYNELISLESTLSALLGVIKFSSINYLESNFTKSLFSLLLFLLLPIISELSPNEWIAFMLAVSYLPLASSSCAPPSASPDYYLPLLNLAVPDLSILLYLLILDYPLFLLKIDYVPL